VRQTSARVLNTIADWSAAGWWLCLSLTVSLAMDCCVASKALAQPPRPGGPPGVKAPPNAKPAAGAMAPKKKDEAPLKVPEEPVGPDGLPLNYKPPANPPAVMELQEPLLTEQLKGDWKKIRTKYGTALRNGSMTDADKAIITTGLTYRLYAMAEPENLRDLHERRGELSGTDLGQAGKLLTKAEDVKAFRTYLLGQVVKIGAPLAKNNLNTRYQYATLLGELDLVPEDQTRNLKHETYTPGCDPLIKILDDPEQPQAVKIAAARSLVRLLRLGDCPVELRQRVATSVVAELAKTDTHYWYQMRFAEALSALDITLDLVNRKPIMVSVLSDVVRDPNRDFRARAKAAKALGRVPFDPQVDISGLMRDLMQFALELANAAQQDPQNPQWKQCFWDLYLTYMPADARDRDATKKLPAGLLANKQAASAAQPTYKLILPMVNTVIAGKPIAVPDLQNLQGWLQQNKPNAAVGTVNPGRQPPAPQPQPANATKPK
jgi:hypothetical protein